MRDLKEFKNVSDAIKEVSNNIRDYEDTDEGKYLTVSYSKMSLFNNCHRRYLYQYIEQKYAYNDSIATELGTLFHAILELKGKNIINNVEHDYDLYKSLLYDGIDEETKKHTNHILGVNELKEKYPKEWNTPDKFENTYDNKTEVFLNEVLPTRIEDDGWKVLACEHPFKFVYDDKIIIHGFIDRIDYREDKRGNRQYRVVDYKTSKAIYDESETKTSLQMFTYALAILHEFGSLPTEYLYDFIAINKTQSAMTNGYFKRGIKKINKFIEDEMKCKEKDIYKPSPSPLCYFCSFHDASSPHASEKYEGLCKYHSLWTPENRTFETKEQWNGGSIRDLGNKPKERRFVF